MYEFCIAGHEIEIEKIRGDSKEMHKCYDEQSRIADLLAKRKITYEKLSASCAK